MPAAALRRRGLDAAASAPLTYDQTILATPGLLSYWPLVSDLSDLGPNNHPLTLYQPDPTNAYMQPSASPDGRNLFRNGGPGAVGSGLSAGPIYDSLSNGDFTCELLFYPIEFKNFNNDDKEQLVGRWGPGSNGWAFLTHTYNQLEIYRYGGPANDDIGTGYGFPTDYGLYHFEHDGSNLNIYRNGARVVGPFSSPLAAPVAAHDLMYGRNPDQGGVMNAYWGRLAIYQPHIDAATKLAHAQKIGLA